MSETEQKSPWALHDTWVQAQCNDDPSISQVYAEARSKCPVQRVVMPGGESAWVAIGRAEVEKVLMTPEVFSSAQYQMGPELVIPIELDPPAHGPFRRVLNPLVSIQTAAKLEPTVRGYARELVGRFVANGGGDLRPLADELSLRTLCALLGISDQEWSTIRDTQKSLTASEISRVDEDMVNARFAALKPVMDFAQTLLDQRKQAPADDFVSGLVLASIEGRSLTDAEMMQIMILILMAGHETTRTAIEGATLLLSQHPEQQARLRADFSLIPNAIEECLRHEAPVQALNRKVTQDIEIAGVNIAAGERVMPAYGAANFDPSAFEYPATFDIARKPNRHFTFGRGVHTCLGAPIARMELRVFLEEMLSQTASFSHSGPVEREMWPDSTMKHLLVRAVAA